MTIVEMIAFGIIASIPIWCIVICFIVALGKKPGYRRRSQREFDGKDRRCPLRPTCPKGKSYRNPSRMCPDNHNHNHNHNQPTGEVVQEDDSKVQ